MVLKYAIKVNINAGLHMWSDLPTKNKALMVLVLFAPVMEQYEGQHVCNPTFDGF